eukprot:2240999-Prymnesium_polylepis.1
MMQHAPERPSAWQVGEASASSSCSCRPTTGEHDAHSQPALGIASKCMQDEYADAQQPECRPAPICWPPSNPHNLVWKSSNSTKHGLWPYDSAVTFN